MEYLQQLWSALRRVPDYTWYGILVAIYLVLSMATPVNPHTLERLHLDAAQYHAFMFAVILPYVLIWFAAFFAYVTLGAYANSIKKSKEGPAFIQIAQGVRVMAWGLAIPAIISAIVKAIATVHPDFEDSATIISNYVTLLVPLIAFAYISAGTRKLSDLVKTRPTLIGIRMFSFAFIVMGVYYVYLTLRARFVHGDPYHLSLVGTLMTIIVPYLFAWFMGLLATLELMMYATKITGVLYKQSLNLLAYGISLVIGSSIFIQYVTVIFAYKST
ncbi:MAG TPA: hypothetical protein VFL85_02230, partial [Candidatus Saccharimonadales bacterium]|nr:hypothetical protein [Candidatus Saccharimonadales bacterium]